MPWRLAHIDEHFDVWASGRSERERLKMLSGLAELADKLANTDGVRHP